MEIKCPICGKKYSYDRKICQECEDQSINSELADFYGEYFHKWNCTVFLEMNSTAFKTNNVSNLTKSLSPEPNNLVIYERKLYDWNCEASYQRNGYKSDFQKVLTLGDFAMYIRNKSNSHLFYE